MAILSLRTQMQTILSSILQKDSLSIDATAGNGFDTLFLAQHSPFGHIYAFDIQAEALSSTTKLLEEHTCTKNVTLFHKGHETLYDTILHAQNKGINKNDMFFQKHSMVSEQAILPESKTMLEHTPITAIIFNLGYLPRSDKRIITKAFTTRSALEQAIVLLKPSGILAVHSYQGHEGGTEEHNDVYSFFSTLQWNIAHVTSYEFINKNTHKETLFLAEKI